MTTTPRRFLTSAPTAAGRQGDSAPASTVDRSVSVREFLTAGGLRGFTTADMFPGVTA